MTIIALSDLFTALQTANTAAIIGTVECEWLDFKAEPYILKNDDAKLELTKDVTGLANAGGGVIVLGFSTIKSPDSAVDIAEELRRIPKNMVDVDQHVKILEEWTYPPVRGLNFRWWMEEGEKGVLTIEVPAANEIDRPILVLRARTNDAARKALLVGVFVRTGDRVSHITAAEIHTWIRDGRRFAQLGLSGATVAAQIAPGPTDERRQQRMDDDAAASGLAHHRRYVLQAWPLDDTRVSSIHDPEGLRRVLYRPNEVRSMGFGLRSFREPSVIPGGGLRVMTERQSVSIERDGLLTWVVTAGPDFLAWATESKFRQPFGINPTALVEGTLEFYRVFINEILSRCEPRPETWATAGGLFDVHQDGSPSTLPEEPLTDYHPFMRWVPAPKDEIRFGTYAFRNETSGQAAYVVLREIYGNFGLDAVSIPYTKGDEVSEEILRLKQG